MVKMVEITNMTQDLISIAYFLGILLILNILSFFFYKHTGLIKPKHLYWYFFVISMIISYVIRFLYFK